MTLEKRMDESFELYKAKYGQKYYSRLPMTNILTVSWLLRVMNVAFS